MIFIKIQEIEKQFCILYYFLIHKLSQILTIINVCVTIFEESKDFPNEGPDLVGLVFEMLFAFVLKF
jgi:hypothetical protein